ncbi:hypothetical protein [Vulcanisaeta distributa]|uniref:Uncharacterized protein n=1 Tax=Vulcanisaeta distributa (strain DSM 14429 / JCM 11212 / NBRC 100878 / IC-017) TaxID=572478 RepID=E1QQD5_VULDI|nr:hypothetical protein [Vulcanisaeta distributa]ADN51622.1 hypothetical protein Vdis_2254 [Vulcanisaeta distributa DSM 14429]
MNVDKQEPKDIWKIDRRVKIDEVRKTKLRVKPINVKVITLGKEEQRLIKKWSSECAGPLRGFCTTVLIKLLTYFTSRSIDDLLNEVTRKGLSLEATLILLSQYDLVNNDDTLIRSYLNTGNTDINLLINILSKNGINIKPEDLEQIIQSSKDKVKRRSRLFPKLLKH